MTPIQPKKKSNVPKWRSLGCAGFMCVMILVATVFLLTTAEKQAEREREIANKKAVATEALNQKEEERKAKIKAEADAEEELQAKKLKLKNDKAAALRRVLELEENGLALVKKSLKATTGKHLNEISGVLINRRGVALEYVEVTFILFNKSGQQVGSAWANTKGLKAGDKWFFKAPAFERFRTFKFSQMSGW